MYQIEFDVVAIFLCSLALTVFYLQKQFSNRRSKLFLFMLWVILGNSIFSLINSLAFNSLHFSGGLLIEPVITVYLIFNMSIPVLFCLYLFALVNVNLTNKLFRVLFFLPWFLIVVIIFLNPMNNVLFFVDSAGSYSSGIGHNVLYFVPVFYFSNSFFFLILKRKEFLRKELKAYLISLCFPFAAFFLQVAIQGLSIESFAVSLAVLFLLLTIQNTRDLIDGVTGLYNRETFLLYLQDYFLRKYEFSFIMVRSRELHVLQRYLNNRTYNRLLHSISAWLTLLAGKYFMVFSLEDGLFAFISSHNIDESAVGELSLEIITRSSSPWGTGTSEIEIPFQIGIIRCPSECPGLAEVMDHAEQFITLTEVHADRHVLYGKDFVPKKHLREALVAFTLQESLKKGELELYYQPIFSNAEARSVALEVLVNLALPDGQKVYQSEVFHTAERIGLGQNLGELIMETAFTWFVTNNLPGFGIQKLQVRLLESQCIEIDWPDAVLRIAKKTGMDLAHLCLEITEPSVVNTINTLKANMDSLLWKNISFALDDYGSGYTDFGEILEIPFTMIKLDKKIVHAGLQTQKGERLLQGTISLFKQIGWPIVAEGIETEEQATILIRMGCEYLQGYWAGYPSTGEDVLQQLSIDITPKLF